MPEPVVRQRRDPLDRAGLQPRRPGEFGQRRRRGDVSPGPAQRRQPPQDGKGHCRCGVQHGVGAAVRRQDGQRDALGAGDAGQFVQPVGPVASAADQPDEDAPGRRKGPLDIGVDGQRMAQARKIGQPQRRQPGPAPLPACREGAEVAVREGQDHQIRGRLPQILGLGGFLQPVAFAEQDVHQASAARIASASMSPFSAITTRQPRRGRSPQGRSNWWRTRAPTA